jgi:hypothetical protein
MRAVRRIAGSPSLRRIAASGESVEQDNARAAQSRRRTDRRQL